VVHDLIAGLDAWMLERRRQKRHSQLAPEPAQEQARLGLLWAIRHLRQDKILTAYPNTRLTALATVCGYRCR
jgi:hypothetical protein